MRTNNNTNTNITRERIETMKTYTTKSNITRRTLDFLFSKIGYGRIEVFEMELDGYRKEIEKLTKQNGILTTKKNKLIVSRSYYKTSSKKTKENLKVSEFLLNEEGERQMKLGNKK